MSTMHDEVVDVARATKTYAFDIDPDDERTSHGIVISLVGRDQRVLEVGCGSGYVSRHLVERGNDVVGIDIDPDAVNAARQVIAEVHCCDLDIVDASSVVSGPFDVIVLADVLEHVRDPDRVLADLLGVLAPDGRVVLSIPNVAHVDVRLMLLLGEWRYQTLGLLDDSHLRWFTRRSIAELLRAARLEPVAVRRTVAGAFGSGIELPRDQIPAELVAALLADAEATTFQFVVEAARTGGDWTLLDSDVATVVLPDAAAARADAEVLRGLLVEREAALVGASSSIEQLHAEIEVLRRHVDDLVAAEEAWRNTRLVRYTAPLRGLWARARHR
jgi:2-polyprenyl-3-methyl-5-hydroxy-6-metoxy-1,4-benzoquinol methylase